MATAHFRLSRAEIHLAGGPWLFTSESSHQPEGLWLSPRWPLRNGTRTTTVSGNFGATKQTLPANSMPRQLTYLAHQLRTWSIEHLHNVAKSLATYFDIGHPAELDVYAGSGSDSPGRKLFRLRETAEWTNGSNSRVSWQGDFPSIGMHNFLSFRATADRAASKSGPQGRAHRDPRRSALLWVNLRLSGDSSGRMFHEKDVPPRA